VENQAALAATKNEGHSMTLGILGILNTYRTLKSFATHIALVKT
jgi:hypothetical protein